MYLSKPKAEGALWCRQLLYPFIILLGLIGELVVVEARLRLVKSNIRLQAPRKAWAGGASLGEGRGQLPRKPPQAWDHVADVVVAAVVVV